MLLVIDVGNTNMEFGVYRGEALVGSFRLMTDANRTSDELGLWLCQYFQRFGLELGQVEDVVIGSVAPQVMHTLSRAVQKYVGKTPLVLDEALDPGLPYVECDSDERLGPDRAVGLDALADELKKSGNPQFLVGDGALLCYTTLKELGLDIRLAPPHLRHQSAWGVARCALELTRAGRLTDAAGLTPNYHRLSQAERERLEKEQHKGESCHGHGKSTHFGPPSAAAQAVHPAG